MKTLTLILLLYACEKEAPKEQTYCATCYTKTQNDTLCGTHRQVNDWFYEYAIRREQNNEDWHCDYIK